MCVCQIKLAVVIDTVEQELPAVTLYILVLKQNLPPALALGMLAADVPRV